MRAGTDPITRRLGQKEVGVMRWKKLLIRVSLWLVTEISLNCLGLDTLADYSEFVFERKTSFSYSF
jgi:hypothetical protein